MSSRAIGDFQLLEQIGTGGFAVVYRAVDRRSNRPVALKLLHAHYANEAELINRLRREASTLAALKHIHILPFYQLVEANGQIGLAMAYIAGGSLADYLKIRGRLPIGDALFLLDQLASAIDYLAAKGIVHRDLKPANVLIQSGKKGPFLLLGDFGIVRLFEESKQITQSGALLGTPAYMAPEQFSTKQFGQISSATDLYALGVIAYELIVGTLPFHGDLHAMMMAHLQEKPPIPSETDLPIAVLEMLQQGLAKPQQERFESGRAFVDALRAAAARGTAENERPEAAFTLVDSSVLPNFSALMAFTDGQMPSASLPIEEQIKQISASLESHFQEQQLRIEQLDQQLADSQKALVIFDQIMAAQQAGSPWSDIAVQLETLSLLIPEPELLQAWLFRSLAADEREMECDDAV